MVHRSACSTDCDGSGDTLDLISEQLQELGHQAIVANVRELRAISHSDRKSDHADAEKLARFARLDPEILRPLLIESRPVFRDPVLLVDWGYGAATGLRSICW